MAQEGEVAHADNLRPAAQAGDTEASSFAGKPSSSLNYLRQGAGIPTLQPRARVGSASGLSVGAGECSLSRSRYPGNAWDAASFNESTIPETAVAAVIRTVGAGGRRWAERSSGGSRAATSVFTTRTASLRRGSELSRRALSRTGSDVSTRADGRAYDGSTVRVTQQREHCCTSTSRMRVDGPNLWPSSRQRSRRMTHKVHRRGRLVTAALRRG